MDSLEIKEKVGKGGFGEVFRAVDAKTGEVYALKRLEKLDKETEQGVINREAELQVELHHPNIVRSLWSEGMLLSLVKSTFGSFVLIFFNDNHENSY